MKRTYNQLREVTYIGGLRTGPHGGQYRLLELECGHYKAWSAHQPKHIMAPPRLVPKRARCMLCGPVSA